MHKCVIHGSEICKNFATRYIEAYRYADIVLEELDVIISLDKEILIPGKIPIQNSLRFSFRINVLKMWAKIKLDLNLLLVLLTDK